MRTISARRTVFGIACLCVLGITAFLGSSAPSVGAAESFPGQGFLPDNRAWELVSPPDKNGGDVLGLPHRTQVAVDGDAVTFVSLAGFGDVEGMGIGSEYLAERTASSGGQGWSTHGITPPQLSMLFLGHVAESEARYDRQLSDDLSTGVIQAWSPLTDAPMVANVSNLYLRDDLRSPGGGSYQHLSDCTLCVAPIPPLQKLAVVNRPKMAGASEDFGDVIFESALNLVSGATGTKVKLYHWDHGTLRLAGILPNGQSATSSVAGLGTQQAGSGLARYASGREISSDGSRIVFNDGAKSTGEDGNLFMRINARATVKLNASERTAPDSSSPATYWDGSTDGSRVFFTANEALTDDAPADNLPKLYMWKQRASNEVQQLSVDANAGTFTLSFQGKSTPAIPFNETPGNLRDALAALPTIGEGNVSVSDGPGDEGANTPYKITFTGDFAGANVAELSVNGTSLTGGGATATVATTKSVENLEFISADEEPADGSSSQVKSVIGASEDGDYVYFVQAGQSVPGGPRLIDINVNVPGIFVWNEGTVSFISKVERYPASVFFDLHNQHVYTGGRKQARVTPDGRHLLFGLRNVVGPTGYEHGAGCFFNEFETCRQLYVYDAEHSTAVAPSIDCVSCRPDGVPGNADAFVYELANYGAAKGSGRLNRPISDDGRYVFFSTAQELVPGDLNGPCSGTVGKKSRQIGKCIDVYVYDTVSDEVSLLSSGTADSASYFLEASPDGKNAFFVTRAQLSARDVDQSYDLYDARVGGGFPEPALAPAGCSGEGCQGAPVSAAPTQLSAAGVAGPGNPVPSREVKKKPKKIRKHRKQRHGKSAGKRTAKQNRRASR